jgi:uncharacterized protein (DUF1697 family)
MRYIALLRGINVGGATMMKMDDLKAEFQKLGFENVKSYINSGNIGFDAATTAESRLVAMLEAAIEARFGRAFSVMVRKQEDLPRIIAANPFEGKYESHKAMHLLFLADELPADKEAQLVQALLPGDACQVIGREIYWHLPAGIADSLLGKGFMEKKLKVPATARNWRTVEKLVDL